ncbi:MAG: hypothetical protein KAQ97_03680 [Candidatus Fermentibacteraceae bacterium]|nr:hypothetical protein [Candidatus Fermentibacteraceae bacterium]
MFRLNNPESRFILIRIGIIAGIILLISVVVALGMKMMNKSIGFEQVDIDADQDEGYSIIPDSLWNEGDTFALPEIEDLPEEPEASWQLSPCSIYVTESSDVIVDSLPTAPNLAYKPLEAQFLIRKWAEQSGMESDIIDHVYVFTKFDTIYVDLPSEADLSGLKLTIESRFICFTRLFPLVAGNVLSSYPEGIPLRGVKGVFR